MLTKGLHRVVIYTHGSRCTRWVLSHFSQEEVRYTTGTQEGAKASLWLAGDRREAAITNEAEWTDVWILHLTAQSLALSLVMLSTC